MAELMTATATYENVRNINYNGELYAVPEGMTAADVVATMDTNGYSLDVEGNTLFVMQRTGSKGL